MPGVQVVHGLHGDHEPGVGFGLGRGDGEAQAQLFAAVDHVAEHLVDGVGVGAGPAADVAAQGGADFAQERGGGGLVGKLRVGGEELEQVRVIEVGELVGVEQLFFAVVLAQGGAVVGEGFGGAPAADRRAGAAADRGCSSPGSRAPATAAADAGQSGSTAAPEPG